MIAQRSCSWMFLDVCMAPLWRGRWGTHHLAKIYAYCRAFQHAHAGKVHKAMRLYSVHRMWLCGNIIAGHIAYFSTRCGIDTLLRESRNLMTCLASCTAAALDFTRAGSKRIPERGGPVWHAARGHAKTNYRPGANQISQADKTMRQNFSMERWTLRTLQCKHTSIVPAYAQDVCHTYVASTPRSRV